MQNFALDPASNRANFEQSFQFEDADNGDLIDFTGDDILVFSVNDQLGRQVLTASTEDGGITYADSMTPVVSFSRATMTGLCAGEYDVGMTMERNGETTQMLVGTIQIVDGIVPR